MNPKAFKLAVALLGVLFTALFCAVVIPPFLAHSDIVAAFGAGFVNPFASGYSIDVLCCYLLLAVWIVYERSKVKHGWMCLVIGVVPGVALYLLLRTYQIEPQKP